MDILGMLIPPLSIKNTVHCISVANNKYIFLVQIWNYYMKCFKTKKDKLNFLISYGDIGIQKIIKKMV